MLGSKQLETLLESETSSCGPLAVGDRKRSGGLASKDLLQQEPCLGDSGAAKQT